MSNYRRVYVEGECYFFTVVLANRNNRFLTDYIENLHQACCEVTTQ